MARNIEIKARIDSIAALLVRVGAIADSGPTEIFQDDTFFECTNGRLKLRAFSSDAGELIFYRRSDQAGPKESFYVISPTSSPDTLREVLTLAHGTAGRVIKRRILYMTGNTRIHLDDVRGLGEFLELEVVLDDTDSVSDGMAIANSLLTRLGIGRDQLIESAYVDLLHTQAIAAHKAKKTPPDRSLRG